MSPWRRHRVGLPALVPAPRVADLPEARMSAGARYLGTELDDDGAETPHGAPVGDHGLLGRGSCRLSLSEEALDVVRLAGSFRVPVAAVRGARHDAERASGFTLRWQHGEHRLATRFDLTPARGSDAAPPSQPWVRTLAKIAKENA